MLSVIVPASNEEAFIGPCLAALLASDPVPGGAEVVVVANGCRDRTVSVAQGFASRAEAAGWGFTVLDLAAGSKPLALNEGDLVAQGDLRAYLDADVVVSAPVMAQLALALAGPDGIYAGATPVIPRAKSGVTRAYARFWSVLPFARSVAAGYGLFAVNTAGRARWGAFPSIISDDTFVRLQFQPEERVQVPGTYMWPMIEGFAALVRVRRRQDAGVAELDRLHPGILARQGKAPLRTRQLAWMVLADPAGFAVYGAVSLAVRARRGSAGFTRGR